MVTCCSGYVYYECAQTETRTENRTHREYKTETKCGCVGVASHPWICFGAILTTMIWNNFEVRL